MDIAIIGSGGVATHLALALHNVGHNITSVYSRNIDNAKILANRISAFPIDNISDVPKSNIIVIAVSDDSIESVLNQLTHVNSIVCHTSGSVTLDVFGDRFKQFGSFYPLQTFTKSKSVSFSDIPIFIESNNPLAEAKLLELARSISNNVNTIDSAKRAQLHIAAVFACNFTNHLYSIADDILKKSDLDISVLKPLIEECVNKLNTLSPQQAQTGPAARKDLKIIDKQLDFLSNDKELQQIYKIFTERIIRSNK